ncbi:MAG: transposase [Candidatus Dormibacteraceae bacterium]
MIAATAVANPSESDHPPVGRTPRIGGSHANGVRREVAAGPPPGADTEGVPQGRNGPGHRPNRTVADVARELGVIEQTLGNWVCQERIDRGEREGTSTEIAEENVRLRREVKVKLILLK